MEMESGNIIGVSRTRNGWKIAFLDNSRMYRACSSAQKKLIQYSSTHTSPVSGVVLRLEVQEVKGRLRIWIWPHYLLSFGDIRIARRFQSRAT
ncbi:hypothetical protein I7I53_09244 [Histoplasma capsulatum var. duboisii H88]|uniref:Uncharacterized protein n=1 Tax=Ajellomyces capsulatus (strain H88) TaxID=544711 RepID=A0A8A1LB47_AJEC8|nr:hypothetical protein I7I53_09244 [Histoplasma capsulatum var. duboisii H88]